MPRTSFTKLTQIFSSSFVFRFNQRHLLVPPALLAMPPMPNGNPLTTPRTLRFVRQPFSTSTVLPSAAPLQSALSQKSTWPQLYGAIPKQSDKIASGHPALKNESKILKELADFFRLHHIDTVFFLPKLQDVEFAKLLLSFFLGITLRDAQDSDPYQVSFTKAQLKDLAACSYDQLKGIHLAIDAYCGFNRSLKYRTVDSSIISCIIQNIKNEKQGQAIRDLVRINAQCVSEDPKGNSYLTQRTLALLIENPERAQLIALIGNAYIQHRKEGWFNTSSDYKHLYKLHSFFEYQTEGPFSIQKLEYFFDKIQRKPMIPGIFDYWLQHHLFERLSCCTHDDSVLDSVIALLCRISSPSQNYNHHDYGNVIARPQLASLVLSLLDQVESFHKENRSVDVKEINLIVFKHPSSAKDVLLALYRLATLFPPARGALTGLYSSLMKCPSEKMADIIQVIDELQRFCHRSPGILVSDSIRKNVINILHEIFINPKRTEEVLAFIAKYDSDYHPDTIPGLNVFFGDLNKFVESLNPETPSTGSATGGPTQTQPEQATSLSDKSAGNQPSMFSLGALWRYAGLVKGSRDSHAKANATAEYHKRIYNNGNKC